MQDRKYKLFENLVYTVLWILVFSAPYFLLQDTGRPHHHNRMRVIHETSKILPFLLIFLLNNQLLFNFLRQKKYPLYFGTTFAAILILSYLATKTQLFFQLFNFPGPPLHRPRSFMANPMNHLFYNAILSLLVVGFNDAVKIGINWMEDRKNFEALQKENFRTQLAYLKHQVSPHFFMNTLNNIHALIDLDKEKAKEAVVKLSTLMRVLLYESETEYFSLKKEIAFVKDYIELMKMRVDEKVDIRFDYPVEIPDVKIPPLLFISFVENAFKHGIRASGRSFIHVTYRIEEDRMLEVKVRNSKARRSELAGGEKIGLDNSGKRLELLYKNRHRFEITDLDDTFEVIIEIPLE